MPPGIKSIVYLDNILVYSEDPTGRSVSYMDDMMPYKQRETGSRGNPKIWQELTETGSSKRLYPKTHVAQTYGRA